MLYQLSEEANNSDEERYNHTLRRNPEFKFFEEARDVYITFALQLIKSHNELEKAYKELDYIYSTVFRLGDYERLNIQSKTIHLGFFYEIVLSDPDIMVTT
jgi:hypothetical protein